MKKLPIYIQLFALFSLTSCSLFELDNYELPAETVQGQVVDVATGEPVLTDQGSEGIRVRLLETSWGDNATPNPDFFCMPDGSFQHTKLFKGRYNIRIDGPFILCFAKMIGEYRLQTKLRMLTYRVQHK